MTILVDQPSVREISPSAQHSNEADLSQDLPESSASIHTCGATRGLLSHVRFRIRGACVRRRRGSSLARGSQLI